MEQKAVEWDFEQNIANFNILTELRTELVQLWMWIYSNLKIQKLEGFGIKHTGWRLFMWTFNINFDVLILINVYYESIILMAYNIFKNLCTVGEVWRTQFLCEAHFFWKRSNKHAVTAPHVILSHNATTQKKKKKKKRVETAIYLFWIRIIFLSQQC